MLVKPKKQFGQNFLTSPQVVEDILRAGKIAKEDTVLEIGPGRGFLTEKLLIKAKKVIAVEKDRDLLPFLKEKFASFIKKGTLELVEADILTFFPSSYDLKPNAYKLIANIPYYITGEILRKFLETEVQPSLMVLMVQKEVGERIVTKGKMKETILSLSVKAYGTPTIVRKVGRGSFNPSPNVDSVVIKIDGISKKHFKHSSEQAFFKTLHAGFAHKRKFLINNLTSLLPKEKLEIIFKKTSLSPKTRAEDLSLIEWLEITKSISQ